MQNETYNNISRREEKTEVKDIINQSEKDKELDFYLEQLEQQIEEWLEGLNLDLPQFEDKGLRNNVVKDLAGDIVERCRYLQINPSGHKSEDDELELLKFQIFHWINKLVGKYNTKTIDHARELMQRIRNIPIPSDIKNLHRMTYVDTSNTIHNIIDSDNANHIRFRDLSKLKTPKTNYVDKLNDEFKQFIKDWIEKIPITGLSIEEQALIDKITQGIFNGIWKAIVEVRSDPEAFHNDSYFNDKLDEEIEDIFSFLPQTSDFLSVKKSLKAEMLQKALEVHKSLKVTSTPHVLNRFKVMTELVNKNVLPYYAMGEQEQEKLLEEKDILDMINLFMKQQDIVNNNEISHQIFQNRLKKSLREFYNSLKSTYHRPLIDIGKDLYLADAFTILKRVPLPDKDNVSDEEYLEVFIGFEIDQWFAEVPVTFVIDERDQLFRMILKNSLSETISTILKNSKGRITPEVHYEILTELFNFFKKMPFQSGSGHSSQWMPYFEEIVHRLLRHPVQTEYIIKKTQNREATYDDFERHVALCSSPKPEEESPAKSLQMKYMVTSPKGTKFYDHNKLLGMRTSEVPQDNAFEPKDKADIPRQEPESEIVEFVPLEQLVKNLEQRYVKRLEVGIAAGTSNKNYEHTSQENNKYHIKPKELANLERIPISKTVNPVNRNVPRIVVSQTSSPTKNQIQTIASQEIPTVSGLRVPAVNQLQAELQQVLEEYKTSSNSDKTYVLKSAFGQPPAFSTPLNSQIPTKLMQNRQVNRQEEQRNDADEGGEDGRVRCYCYEGTPRRRQLTVCLPFPPPWHPFGYFF